MNNAFLTDKDVQTILRISGKTLNTLLKNGRTASCSIDLRKAGAIRVGIGRKHGQRRWPISKFAEITGISREDIWALLS